MAKAKKAKKKGEKKEEKKKETVKTPAIAAATLESTLTEPKSDTKPEKKKVTAYMHDERVLTESCDEARDLYSQSRYGTIVDDGKVQLSLLEGMYLKEKGKLIILDSRGKDISTDLFLKKAKRQEANFWTKYCVYKDFRNRGYIIKTALKFGADFRVYDRGVKPGEDHAKWVVFPVREGETLTWYDFAAKNRVAHSTKKRLLIGITDEEGDVTYYEIRWMRP